MCSKMTDYLISDKLIHASRERAMTYLYFTSVSLSRHEVVYMGNPIWNGGNIKGSRSLSVLKKKLKCFYVEQYGVQQILYIACSIFVISVRRKLPLCSNCLSNNQEYSSVILLFFNTVLRVRDNLA